MGFIVTARKWRPQNFEDVVGQEHITKTLKNAIVNNRIAHAYIFAGPRGVGKTTTARILAKSLNCLNPKEGEPCNNCEMCNSFQNSQSLDIIEIDGASNRRIEEIRTLRESVKYAPTKGTYKIYIIDEVHMLTTESFNALLKTLEEPPEHTLFIFATTDIHKVPLTIISRCQRFDFRRIELKTIKALLAHIAEEDNISIDDKTLTLIAKKADGALRDAESLFDQVVSFCGNKVEASDLSSMLNLIDEEVYFEITDSILAKKFASAFEITQRIYDNGWNFVDFLNGMNEHFRNIMTVIIRKDSSLVETAEVYKERYLKYKDLFSEGDILRILSFLNKTSYELKSAQNQKIKIEIALCNLIGLERSYTISKLISQVESGTVSYSAPAVEPETPRFHTPVIPIKEESNLSPVRKDEIKIPKVKSFVAPAVTTGDVDFTHVINEWKGFVDQIKNEKFFFGSILTNSNPVQYSGNKLHVQLENPDDTQITTEYKGYLEKKSQEVFGKKIDFNFSAAGTPDKAESFIATQNAPEGKAPGGIVDEDPLINAVINELGGREIKES
jgi:DNA polymerase-3 subunit gamma/tau